LEAPDEFNDVEDAEEPGIGEVPIVAVFV